MSILVALLFGTGALTGSVTGLAHCLAAAERALTCVANGNLADWDRLERQAYAEHLLKLSQAEDVSGMAAGPQVARLARDEADWRADLPDTGPERIAALAARIDELGVPACRGPERTE